MKYRKKPLFIDAFKWTGDREQTEDPKWIIDAIEEGKVWFNNIGTPNATMVIKTLEGNHIANRGDYIIKCANGEIYPCKPEIFEMTYETTYFINWDDCRTIDIGSIYASGNKSNCEVKIMLLDLVRNNGLTMKDFENCIDYVRESFYLNAVIK